MKYVRLRLDFGNLAGDLDPLLGVFSDPTIVEYTASTHWLFSDRRLECVYYVEGNRDAFATAIDGIPQVLDWETITLDDRSWYAYVHHELQESVCEVFELFESESVDLIPPIEYPVDGALTYAVVGGTEAIQVLLNRIPEPVSVTVEPIAPLRTASATDVPTLTDPEREAIRIACDLGYYARPREATLEDVADELASQLSVVADRVRTAEVKLLRSVLGERNTTTRWE